MAAGPHPNTGQNVQPQYREPALAAQDTQRPIWTTRSTVHTLADPFRWLLDDVLCLAPPFTISDEMMGRAVEILSDSIAATAGRYRR